MLTVLFNPLPPLSAPCDNNWKKTMIHSAKTTSYVAATDMSAGDKVAPADAAIQIKDGQGVSFENVKYTVATRKGT